MRHNQDEVKCNMRKSFPNSTMVPIVIEKWVWDLQISFQRFIDCDFFCGLFDVLLMTKSCKTTLWT